MQSSVLVRSSACLLASTGSVLQVATVTQALAAQSQVCYPTPDGPSSWHGGSTIGSRAAVGGSPNGEIPGRRVIGKVLGAADAACPIPRGAARVGPAAAKVAKVEVRTKAGVPGSLKILRRASMCCSCHSRTRSSSASPRTGLDLGKKRASEAGLHLTIRAMRQSVWIALIPQRAGANSSSSMWS